MPDSAYADEQFAVTAIAEDAYNNVVTSYAADVTYSSNDDYTVFKNDPSVLGSVSGGTFSGGSLAFYVTFGSTELDRLGPNLTVTVDDGNGGTRTFSTYVTIDPG